MNTKICPKISIVIPVYNSEKYLRNCLDSILVQTYTDFEVLLINDGSTDNSGQICDEYTTQDARFKVFHKENGGVSSARNLGIKNTSGEFICFIDSDDYVKKTYLENFRLENCNVDLFVQGYTEVIVGKPDQVKQIIKKEKTSVNVGNYLEFLEYKTSMAENPWGKLFRRTILVQNSILFDVNISNGEDHLFVLEYFKYVNSLCMLSSVDYFYRRFYNNDSLSMRVISYIKHLEYTDKIYLKRQENLVIHNMSSEYNYYIERRFIRDMYSVIKLLYNSKSEETRRVRIELLRKYFKKFDTLKSNRVNFGSRLKLIYISSYLFYPLSDILIKNILEYEK